MNKIFKVLWNKSRARFVVTNEAQRACGKAKSETKTLAFGVAALLGVASYPAQAEITVADGWSHTSITPSAGNVVNIKTDHIQSGIGINKFNKFTVDKGNIANLIVPGSANNLLNFVNDSININGTVNSLKGTSVGGNLFFVTPSGMTVGATGVINAGSLTAIVATKSAYEKWTKVSNGTLEAVNAELLENMRLGAVALNPTGVITVNGNINTGNRIVLAASQIHIGAGATLSNKRAVDDFKTLVNIPASSGIDEALAGVEGTLEARETADGTGDILLIARSDMTGNSVLSTNPTVNAIVNIDGTIDSREDVAAGALAGNGTYDTGKKEFTSSANSSVATINAKVNVSGKVYADKNLDLSAEAQNIVKQGGIVQTIKDTTLSILGSLTAINVAVDYGNLTTLAKVDIAESATLASLGDLTVNSVSATTLEIGASLFAVKFLNLLASSADKIPSAATVVAFADSTSNINLKGTLSSGGSLTLSATDTLVGKATATASMALVRDDNPAHVAFTYADFKGNASVDVADTAHLKLTGLASDPYGGKVAISAKRTSRIETSTTASVDRASYGALAFNYTSHDTSSSVNLNTGLEGLPAESLTIQSENITTREELQSQTFSVSVEGLPVKLTGLVTALSTDFLAGLMGQASKGIENSFTAQNFRTGGAVGVITGTQKSSIVINGSSDAKTFSSVGNVLIESTAKKKDHHYHVRSQTYGRSASEGQEEGTQTQAASSIALLVQTHGAEDTLVSNVAIGENLTIESTAGNLTVNNVAAIEYDRINVMIEDVLEKIVALKSLYEKNAPTGDTGWNEVDEAVSALQTAKTSGDTKTIIEKSSTLMTRVKGVFSKLTGTISSIYGLVVNAAQFLQIDSYVNSYVSAFGGADAGKWDAGGAIAVLAQSTSSNLTIGKKTLLLAGTAGSDTAAHLNLTSESTNESIALGGHLRTFFGVPLPTVDDGNSIGATVLVQSLQTNNNLIVREGVQLEDKTQKGLVTVTAKDRVENVAIGASGDVGKGSIGISANAAVALSHGANRLWIDDEAKITGGSITLEANRKDSVQAVVGTASIGSGDQPSANTGASVAVNLVTFTNKLQIEDNDSLNAGESSIGIFAGEITASDAAGSGVAISAQNDTTMNSIGVSGGVSTSGTNPEAEEEDKPDDEASDENPGFWRRVGTWFKDRASDVGEAVSSAKKTLLNTFDTILVEAPKKANEAGASIREGVSKITKQNSTNNTALNNADGSDVLNDKTSEKVINNGEADIAGANGEDPLAGEQGKHFQIGLAASVAWNKIDIENTVTIKADSLTINAPKLNVTAVTDKWIGAWTGAAGISYTRAENAQTSSAAGVGGAIAVNSGTIVNKVDIAAGSAGTGLVLGTGVTEVNIRAINDGTVIAEGLSAGVASSASEEGGNQYSFEASVSVNLLTDTVRADVDSVTQQEGASNVISWNQAAWSGETQVTGGTGFGASIQSGDASARSVGLLAAYAEINNTVASTLKNTKLYRVSDLKVRSLSSLTQVTTAVGANVSTGDSSSSLTGAGAGATFTNTVASGIENSSITLIDGGDALILASGIKRSDSEEFTNLSTWEAEGNATKNTASELTNTNYYKDVTLKTEKEQEKDSGKKLSELGSSTGMLQTTVALSIAASKGGSAGGAGVVVNKIGNTFETTLKGSTISTSSSGSAGSYTQRAESNSTSIAVATGVASAVSGSGTQFAAGGSVVVSNVDQSASSLVDASTITSDTVKVQSSDTATTVNVAGEFGISLGESASGGGAAVVVMNTNNIAQVDVRNSSKVITRALTLEAMNAAKAWGVAADVAVTSRLAIAGSVLVNRVKNESAIKVSGLTVTDATTVLFNAKDTSELWSLAGSVGFGGDSAGVSGAVAYSISGLEDSAGTAIDVTDLTLTRHESSEASNFEALAEATDKLHTLVIAAGISATGVAGFTGASGVNEVKRKTTSTVKNLKTNVIDAAGTVVTGTAPAIGALSVKATEKATISNLGIAGAYGTKVGGGVGIAVNRITTTTNANLTGEASSSEKIKAKTLAVTSKTSNKISNIAVGGAGSLTFAASGSTAINKITDNTLATLTDVKADVTGAALVDAQSDDVIGAYAGQAEGSGAIAGGLSVTVNNRFGETSAQVSGSEVTQTGTSSDTLTAQGGVDKTKINDKIVNEISINSTLEDDRATETVNGIRISATSTTCFKSLVINGAGAALGAGAGTATVTYHGGATKVTVQGNTLRAKNDVTVASGDYVNIDNILTAGAGSGSIAIDAAVNVATTEHTTSTTVEGGSLTSDSGAVAVKADAKEGVSSLAIAGGGALLGAGGALVNVTRELSDVSVNLSQTTRTALAGNTVTVASDYLGRYNALAITGNGAVVGAVALNVAVNYADNDVLTALGKSEIKARDAVSVTSLRETENSGIDVTAVGSKFGSMAATVLVNTVEGSSKVTAEGANATGLTDSTVPTSVTIKSSAKDVFDLVEVNAGGSLFGNLGALVVVNRFFATAQTALNLTTIAGDTVSIKAEQNRDIDATDVYATLAIGTLGANVLSTTIGSGGDPFAASQTGLTTLDSDVKNYTEKYGASSTEANTGILSTVFKATGNALTSAERTEVIQAAARSVAATQTGGTHVAVNASSVSAKTLNVFAEEETDSSAQKKMTVGSGAASMVTVVPSVVVLNEKRNVTTTIAGSTLTATGTGSVGTLIGAAESLMRSIQGSLAAGSLVANSANIAVTGGSNVILDKATLNSASENSTFTVSSVDKSKEEAYVFGLTVSGADLAGVTGTVTDSSSVGVTVSNGTKLIGTTTINATRAVERKAEVRSGKGGAINGAAAMATVKDSGNTTITISDATASGSSLSVSSLNKSNLFSKAYQGYASAVAVGVLESLTKATGETSLRVTGSALGADTVTLTSETGRITYDAAGKESTADALRMTSEVYSYGAAVGVGATINSAKTVNETATNLTLSGNSFASTTALNLGNTVNTVYDAYSDLGTGGIVAGGASYAGVIHGATTTTSIASESATLKSFTLLTDNKEAAKLRSYSAGGGAVEVSEKAAHSEHEDKSSNTASISGAWEVLGDINIAHGSEHYVQLLADNTKGAVVGGSSAYATNRMTGTNSLTLAGAIKAGKAVNAATFTYLNLGTIDGNTYAVDTAVYGAINGTKAQATNTIDRNTQLVVSDGARIEAGAALTLSAQLLEESTLRARGRTAGLAEGVTAYNDNTIHENTTIKLGENTLLKNTNPDKGITLAASNGTKRVIEAIGDVQGALFGGAAAKSVNTITETSEIVTASSSVIDGAGNVNLYAGRDALGEECGFDFTGYTHAYAHSIGGTTSGLTDTFAITNRLVLNGNVAAARTINATANLGKWSLSETARYWQLFSSSDAGNVRIATSAAGTKSVDGFNPINSIVVNGTLTAGSQTKSQMTFSGIVDTSDFAEGADSYTIEGSQREATYEHEGVEGTVTYGTENVANTYKERYETLQRLIADYAEGDTQTSQTAIIAYRKEAELLRQKMIDQNLAIFDGTTLVSLVQTKNRGYVKVSNLTVAGGDVNLRTDKVTGNGTIKANAAEGITITNRTNLALVAEDIRILEKGGSLTLNGITVGSFEGFSGAVSSASSQADPTITILSKYNGAGGKVLVTDSLGNSESVTPDNSVTIRGVVANDAGSLAIGAAGDEIAGDITVVANRLAASGSMSLRASRSVMQSYTAGNVSVAGEIESLWSNEVEATKALTSSETYKASTEAKTTTSEGMVAGGDIFISADNINLNGMVQSGYSTWSINLTETELETKVSEITAQWKAKGANRDINPISDEYCISKGGQYKTSDGTYAMHVAAWYDPVNDKVIVDDIAPEGGHVYITGRIASTGGGKIYAASGSANVSINSGTHSVRLGDITTKASDGIIEITDTMSPGETPRAGTSVLPVAKVYRWVDNGKQTQYTVDTLYKDGVTERISSSNMTTGWEKSFTPTSGLSYIWSEGYRTGTVSTVSKEEEFKWWGLYHPSDPSTWGTVTTNKVSAQELGSGTTLYVGLHKDNNYKFNAWKTSTTESEGQWKTTTWTTYDNWTHWSGAHHSHAEKYDTGTEIYTYSVKADEKVDIKFLTSSSNSVDVTSGADIVLGGRIATDKGTVNLTASKNIVNETSEAMIYGAETINLNAAGKIGEKESAIRIAGGTTSETALNAQSSSNGAIYIDASNLNDGVTLLGTTIKGASANITARGSLKVDQLTADDVTLTSKGGMITVGSLTQSTDEESTRRFNATAAENVTVTSTGDIGIGKIVAGGDVTITSTSGAIWDALSREDLDNRNAQERINTWIEAGILGEGGANNGASRWEADVKTQEAIVRADYARYSEYKALTEKEVSNLTDAQKEEFATFKTRFVGVDSADAAVAAARNDSTTMLGRTVADKNSYGWSKTELLYAISNEIVNPNPDYAPSAGEPNVEAKNVKLVAATSAGSELDTKTFKFEDITTENEDAYKTLSRADIDDIKWDKESSSVEVTLKRPISVKLTTDSSSNIKGSLTGNATTGFYVASDEKLRIGDISASAVRLTSQKGIEAISGTTVLGKTAILRGGSGSLGKVDCPINVSASDWVSLSAKGDIYVANSNGDIKLLSAATEGTISLTAKDIYSVSETGQLVEGYIAAKTAQFNLTDKDSEVGTAEKPISLYAADDGSSKVIVKRVGKDVAEIGALYLNVLGEGDLTFDASFVTKKSVGLSSAGNLTITGILAAYDSVSIEAGKSLVAKKTTFEAGKDLTLKATNGDVDLEGSLLKAASLDSTSSASLTVSATGNANLKDVSIREYDKVDLSVTTQKGSVDLSQSESAYALNLKSLTVKAGSDVNISQAKINAKEALTVKAQGTLLATAATLNSGDAVTLSAAKAINAEGASLTGATVSATSSEDSVALDRATISSTALSVSASENASLKDVTLRENDKVALSVTTKKGSVDLSRSESASALNLKSLTVNAGSDVNLSEVKFNTKEVLTVEAGASLLAKSATLNSGDAVTLSATKAINAEGASLTGKTVNVTSSEGEIKAASASLTSSQSMAIAANDASVNLSRATISSGADLTVTAKTDANLSETTITAENGDVLLNASQGDIDLSANSTTSPLVAKSLTVNAGSDVTLSQAKINVTEDLTVKAGGSLLATSVALHSGDALTLSATKEINAEGSTLTGEAVSVTSSKGEVKAASATLTSSQSVAIAANDASVNLSRATISSGADLTVTAKMDSNLSEATISAENGNVLMTTSQGDIDLSASSTTTPLVAKSLTVNAGSDVNLTQAKINVTEDLTVKAGGSLLATSVALHSGDAVTLSAKKTINAEGATLTGTTVSVTSSADSVTLDRATISSTAVTVSASENASLKDVTLRENDKVVLSVTTQKGSVDLSRSESSSALNLASLTVKAGSDVNLSQAKLNTKKALTVEAEGALLATSAVLNSDEAMALSAKKAINAEGASFMGETVSITSSEGEVKAASATLTSSQSMTVTASAASVNLSRATISSGADLTVTAKKDANLSEATITVVNGDVLMTTSQGDIDLSASSTTTPLVAKSFTVHAGKDVDLSGRAVKTSETTNALYVAAGNGVTLKDSSLDSASALLIEAGTAAVEAKDSVLTSAGAMTLSSAKGAVRLTETALNGSSEISLTAKDGISSKDSTVSEGLTKLTFVTDTNDIDVSGNSKLSANTVQFKANASDILLSDAASITGSEAVNLFASGSIIQIDKSTIATPILTAGAGKNLYLSSEIGNDTPTANLSSLGDVALATRTDVRVTVNKDHSDVVFGDLWLDAYGSTLTLTNEKITTLGQVSLRARSISANDIYSADDVFASTAFNGDTTGDSLKIGNVIASEIGLMTEKGQIEAGSLVAYEDSICIYRTSLADAGDIRVALGAAAGKALVYNGNGLISTPIAADKYVRLSLGAAGNIDRSSFMRGVLIRTSPNMSTLTADINEEYRYRLGDYKWFPMLDLGLSSYVTIETAQTELRKTFELGRTIRTLKPYKVDEAFVRDYWTDSVEETEVDPRIFSF